MSGFISIKKKERGEKMQYNLYKILFVFIVFVAQAYLVTIPLLAMDFFNDEDFVATIGVIEAIGGLIFGLLGILIIDNIKNKTTLVISSIVVFIAILSQKILLDESKLIFVFSVMIIIIFARIIENVQNALMFVECHKRGDDGLEFFNKLTSSTYIIIGIIVAPIAVLVYGISGLTFLIVLTLPIIIIASFIKVEAPKSGENKKTTNFKERLKIFFGNKKLCIPVFIINSIMFSALMVSTIYFLYITQELKYSTFEYSSLLAIQSIGSILVSAYLYGKWLKMKPRLIHIVLFTLGIFYLILGFINFNFILLAILAFLMGACLTSLFMLLNERYQKNCPKEIYGTVNSIRITLNNISGLIGSGIGSILYINFGSQVVFVCTFVLLALFSVITYLFKEELSINVEERQNLKDLKGSN